MQHTGKGTTLFRYPNTRPPVLYVGHMHRPVGDPYGMLPHSHPRALEVCLIQKGFIDWWVGSDVSPLRPQDVFVTLPRTPHGTVDSVLSPCEYLWVHLAPDLLPSGLRDVLADPGFAGLHRGAGRVVELVGAIYAEHASPDGFSDQACRSLCELLITELARTRGARPAPKLSDLVVQAQAALVEGENVAEVADRLYISEAWLVRRFRAEVGQTPAAWLLGSKINDAKKCLRTTDDPVTSIAVRLGFSTSQYFATAFLRETGRTPTEYRQKTRGY